MLYEAMAEKDFLDGLDHLFRLLPVPLQHADGKNAVM